MNSKEKIFKSFEMKDHLNPKIWGENDKLKTKIKNTLLAIGQEFHKSLDIDAPIEDIIFTGSLANFNWSDYSDVDLHVLIDFNEFDDKDLIKKYFDAKKAIWNDNHNIKIKGYDVELYAQDVGEPHESTGIYSIMKDEWVKKPKHQDVKIDKVTIKKKVRQFESEYNRILKLFKQGDYQRTKKLLTKIKDKIKKYRKAGLDKGGEMSTENLVFKTMRRSGLMGKISDLGPIIIDKEFTIEKLNESEKKKKLFIPRKLNPNDSRYSEHNNKQPIKNIDGKDIRINQYDYEGRKQGYWEEYYLDGQLDYKGSYVNGIPEGYWEGYYMNGQLGYKGSYVNGNLEGYWEMYYSNGQLRYKGSYKNDKPEGYWEEYYEDGQLESKGFYKNGELIKDLNESEKKKLFIPRKLNPDDSRYSEHNNKQPIKNINGKDIRINQYDYEGRRQGYWEEYYLDGQLDYKGSYVNGIPEGYWEGYYRNGQLGFKGSYNNGKMEGYWERYYENGQLWFKGSFINSNRDGYWEEYYDNGQLFSKGSYKNGDREGYWGKYWF